METDKVFQFTNPDDTPQVEQLLDALVVAGHSNTRARRAVLEALRRRPGPVSPTELLDGGRAFHPALGLVTVYRTLDVLQGLGLVQRLHLEDGCHRYVLSTTGLEAGNPAGAGHDHGHHVICDRCGRAIEFAGCDVEAIVAAVELQTGFEVRHHWLELFGVCPSCRPQEGEMG